MKILLKWLWVNEKIFNLGYMRDDCNYFLYLLKKKINRKQWTITTNNSNNYDTIIYWNHDKSAKEIKDKRKILIVREPPCLIPNNHNMDLYKYYDKVFTYNDSLINNRNILKLNLSQNPPAQNVNNNWSKFCCMINWNKFSFHKNELYSERKKAISFFEKYHPEEFDLFWARWNRFFYPFKTNIKSLFKKEFSFLKLIEYFYIIIFNNNHKSYKWTVENKNKTLSNYKFSICYENQRWIDGLLQKKYGIVFLLDPYQYIYDVII